MSGYEKSAVTDMLAFFAKSGRSKRVTVEKRDFYSLSYRLSGKISVNYGETDLISEVGSITFMPKGLAYDTEILEDTRMAVIHFKLSRDIDFRNPFVVDKADGEIPLLFEKICESYRVDDPMNFSCMSLFYNLLSRLEAGVTRDVEYKPPRVILEARERMIEEYRSPYFSVSVLAENIGISGSYLRREFSKCFGKSPIVYLRDLRIGHAKALLESEYLTVEEIAEQCGFSSASYFIQVFHKVIGVSPDKYRHSHSV